MLLDMELKFYTDWYYLLDYQVKYVLRCDR